MKTIFVALFVVVASAGLLTSAAPTDKTCVKLCPFSYDPICAGPQTGADRAISFGNDCVLANYNCENKKDYVVKSKGECPGAGGVRIS